MKTILLLLTRHYDCRQRLLTDEGRRVMERSYAAISGHVKGKIVKLSSDQPRARQAASLNNDDADFSSHRELCGLRRGKDFRWFAEKLKVLEHQYDTCVVYTHEDFLKKFARDYTDAYERILDETTTPRIVIFDTRNLKTPGFFPYTKEEVASNLQENIWEEIRLSEYIKGKIKLGKPFTDEQEEYLSHLRLLKRALDLQERYPKSRNGELEGEIRRLTSLIEKHESH